MIHEMHVRHENKKKERPFRSALDLQSIANLCQAFFARTLFILALQYSYFTTIVSYLNEF
jgi:hypothetical protein